MFAPRFLFVLIMSLLSIAPSSVAARPIEWVETPQHRGVAILIHGLNNTPAVMKPIAVVLQSLGFTTAIVTLDGHEGGSDPNVARAEAWIGQVQRAALEARERYPQTPLLGLGFSLGGAICLRALDAGAADFRRIVLIAPAIGLKGYTSFIRFITWLRIFGIAVPSFIPAAYRSSSTTPLQHYALLFEIVDKIRTTTLQSKTRATPGLIVLRDGDEFISITKTERFRRESGFTDWRVVTVGESPTGLPAHVMVDERSFGAQNWSRFVDELTLFLRSF